MPGADADRRCEEWPKDNGWHQQRGIWDAAARWLAFCRCPTAVCTANSANARHDIMPALLRPAFAHERCSVCAGGDYGADWVVLLLVIGQSDSSCWLLLRPKCRAIEIAMLEYTMAATLRRARGSPLDPHARPSVKLTIWMAAPRAGSTVVRARAARRQAGGGRAKRVCGAHADCMRISVHAAGRAPAWSPERRADAPDGCTRVGLAATAEGSVPVACAQRGAS